MNKNVILNYFGRMYAFFASNNNNHILNKPFFQFKN
jgi:hypothetical protein